MRVKTKWTSNPVLKILSVAAAFLFWLVIVNITDPMTARTFYDIPVEIINENVITSANQVYEVIEGRKVNVTVKGKRSFVEDLNEEDFTAVADMSGLSKVNAAAIEVKIKDAPSDADYELDWGNAMLKVKLEKRVTRKFKVEVQHQGDLSENYVLGDMEVKPNIVEVSCGESKFKKIDHVGVMVTLNGESEDFDSEYSPILYDEDGDVLDGSNVKFSNDTIKVFTSVLATKEIPVEVKTTGTPASGYRLVQTDFKPESIRVSGSKEALENASTIRIPVSVEGAKSDVQKEEPIINYLSDGLSIVGDTATISIRCEIEKNGQRSFQITPSDIAVKNLPSECTMYFATDAQKYQVYLTGKEKALNGVKQSDLGAYVDLSGLGPGSHTMYVRFVLPDGVRLKNSVRIKVILQSKNSDGGTQEETPQPAASVESHTPDEDGMVPEDKTEDTKKTEE